MNRLIILIIVLICYGDSLRAQKIEYSQPVNTPESCTSIMVGKKASADGSVMTSHTCDGNYRTWMEIVPAARYEHDTTVAINPEVKKVEDLSNTDRARFEKLGEKERLEEVFKFERPYPEIKVTPEVRQAGFESFVTTDDHLMHVTGITKDQNSTKYYITKNSWGTDRNKFGGYLNMSESFVRAKTIYVMVHKDAIPKAIKTKLGIK